jgi:hypothetical protein
MSKEAAERLRKLGLHGYVLTLIEQDEILPVCVAKDCPSPADFDPITPAPCDWGPTTDHYPKLRKDGGTRGLDNVRLMHCICNRLDYTRAHGVPHARDLAKLEQRRLRQSG